MPRRNVRKARLPRHRSNTVHISVIIPSYNAEASLPATLSAIAAQKTACAVETIVVDCSETDTVERLCRSRLGVMVHRVPERFTPGIGRNMGAERATGDLLAFVDADVLLVPDALDRAYAFYRSGHAIFGGALELNEERAIGVASFLEHYFFNHESHRTRPISERRNLSSALMLIDRKLFLERGRFRDIPRLQDTELTERLAADGHTLYFCPQVLGLQTQDTPLREVLRKIFIGGNNLYVIRYKRRGQLMRFCLAITLPALACMKTARIVFRHLQYQGPRGRASTLRLCPLLALAGAVWAAGIYRALLSDGEIDGVRE